ncbi:MAG: hypothetical protein IKA95_04840 [Clostridia bacterium]|nr:hypothetical protein [Clostridia bacterium]
MKKSITVFSILLVLIIGIGAVQYFNRPDGATIESREAQLQEKSKGKLWLISVEEKIDDYIISGIYSGYDESGIAVFEPKGDGKYKLQTRISRDNDRIILTSSYIGGRWYDIIWFNGAKTDNAEITYTLDGVKQEPIIHNSKDMEIFINPAPTKDEYAIDVVYHDSEGNKYK